MIKGAIGQGIQAVWVSVSSITCEDFEPNGLEVFSIRRAYDSLKYYAVLLEMQPILKFCLRSV